MRFHIALLSLDLGTGHISDTEHWIVNQQLFLIIYSTDEPGYNDIGLCDASSVTSVFLWYQLIRHC